MKYEIDYGFGKAILYTPYEDVKDRFYTLASTCYGIRKTTTRFEVLSKSESDCNDFERLEYTGHVYVWREDGARKMLEPFEDEEWDTYYCDEVAYKKQEDIESKDGDKIVVHIELDTEKLEEFKKQVVDRYEKALDKACEQLNKAICFEAKIDNEPLVCDNDKDKAEWREWLLKEEEE